MEGFNYGQLKRIDIFDKIKSDKESDFIFYCDQTFLWDQEDPSYDLEIYNHCLSKYSYLLNADFEKNNDDSNTIVCITTKDNLDVKVIYNNFQKIYKIKKNDVLMFPSFFIVECDFNKIKKTNFAAYERSESFGSGSNAYEVSLILKDYYRIKINADSQQEAIDKAYALGLRYFEHVWDKDTDATFIPQATRGSLWHKNMLKAKKI